MSVSDYSPAISPSDSFRTVGAKPRLVGVGTATPPRAYSQQELLGLFGVTDRRVISIYNNSSIDKRFLTLPDPSPDGTMRVETQGELLQKHLKQGLDIGGQAVTRCLSQSGYDVSDIRYLCCVTTTGLLTPGFSAHLINALGIARDCARIDVVGMGCNAGLNALNAVSSWSAAHPGELAILCCIENCSASYVFDSTIRTAVVNCLFGDGSAALAVVNEASEGTGCAVLKFKSAIIPEHLDAMKFDWDEEHGKFSFFLNRDIPYVVGAYCEETVQGLLSGTGLGKNDIAHWIVHSGGKKVMDAVKINLGLTMHDLRHTAGILRDYGNLSSGSFLFSFERLLQEGIVKRGDYGVMMTMGPGATIESALVAW